MLQLLTTRTRQLSATLLPFAAAAFCASLAVLPNTQTTPLYAAPARLQSVARAVYRTPI